MQMHDISLLLNGRMKTPTTHWQLGKRYRIWPININRPISVGCRGSESMASCFRGHR